MIHIEQSSFLLTIQASSSGHHFGALITSTWLYWIWPRSKLHKSSFQVATLPLNTTHKRGLNIHCATENRQNTKGGNHLVPKSQRTPVTKPIQFLKSRSSFAIIERHRSAKSRNSPRRSPIEEAKKIGKRDKDVSESGYTRDKLKSSSMTTEIRHPSKTNIQRHDHLRIKARRAALSESWHHTPLRHGRYWSISSFVEEQS